MRVKLYFMQFIAPVLCACATGICAAADAKLDLGKFCAGEICLENAKCTLADVFQKFGSSAAIYRADDAKQAPSFCYYDPNRQISAEFTFAGEKNRMARYPLEGITVTTAPICPKNLLSSGKSGGMSVGPIEIGMSTKAVVQKLGEPSRIDDAVAREKKDPKIADTRYSAKFGEQVYVYEKKDDLGFVFVFLRAGKVSTIWASTSE